MKLRISHIGVFFLLVAGFLQFSGYETLSLPHWVIESELDEIVDYSNEIDLENESSDIDSDDDDNAIVYGETSTFNNVSFHSGDIHPNESPDSSQSLYLLYCCLKVDC